METHEILQDPTLRKYLRYQTSNKNDKLNTYFTAYGSTKITAVSKEHITLEDGGTTKTTKTTQHKIKSLQFTMEDQCQASLRIFLIEIGVPFNDIENNLFREYKKKYQMINSNILIVQNTTITLTKIM